jgi:D-alanyl-D-alanine carboxypeptidase
MANLIQAIASQTANDAAVSLSRHLHHGTRRYELLI